MPVPRLSKVQQSSFAWSWALVLLLTVFAVAPLTHPAFFQTHSGFLPALNVAHLADAPAWGRVPTAVRDEGKLPYLLAWPFFRLSGSGIVAVKWGYGLTFLIGALAVLAWTKRWLGAKGAVLAAAVYTYLPWHLGTVYVRGAYGEAWLWALWPLVLWSVDLVAGSSPIIGVTVGSLALAGALWAQPGLAILFLLIAVPYGALQIAAQRRALGGVVALALATGLLWVVLRFFPAVAQPRTGELLYPYQLFSAAWGPRPVVPLSDGNPAQWFTVYETYFQLGLAALGLTIVAVALWTMVRSEEGQERNLSGNSWFYPRPALRAVFWFWVVALMIVAVLTLRPAAFLWRATGFGVLLNQPWQLLALTGFPLAFLAGSVVRLDSRLAERPVWAALVALALLASYPYLAPRFTQVDPGQRPVALLQSAAAEAPQIMLLAADIVPPTSITPTLTLTVTWQALAPVGEDYTVFVHLLSADSEAKVAQQDARPCRGECPTSAWQPGDMVVDRYELTLPPDAPPGPYHLALGFYVLGSGERALVVGRHDGTVYLEVPDRGQ